MPTLSMSPESLERLMAGYQEADEEAARELIQRVSPLLLRYFRGRESQRRFAEDLAQETWVRIHKARHTHRLGEPVMPWVFAIARHTALDFYRRTRRVEMREEQVEMLQEHAADPKSEDAPRMDELLASLPEGQKEVVLLLKVGGLSLEEVARATGSSVGAVKQKAHRAYEALRARFGTAGSTSGRVKA